MKIVYASRKGHVESIINRLGYNDALKINDGSEKVDGDYVLFTYTDGKGVIPEIVEKFLKGNPGIKAVVGSGNKERHPDTYNFAVDKIVKEYNVPAIARVNMEGTEEDLETIKKGIAAL